MVSKKGQFGVVEPMVNNQLNVFGINLNAQPVNGMTHYDLVVKVIRRLLDTLE